MWVELLRTLNLCPVASPLPSRWCPPGNTAVPCLAGCRSSSDLAASSCIGRVLLTLTKNGTSDFVEPLAPVVTAANGPCISPWMTSVLHSEAFLSLADLFHEFQPAGFAECSQMYKPAATSNKVWAWMSSRLSSRLHNFLAQILGLQVQELWALMTHEHQNVPLRIASHHISHRASRLKRHPVSPSKAAVGKKSIGATGKRHARHGSNVRHH